MSEEFDRLPPVPPILRLLGLAAVGGVIGFGVWQSVRAVRDHPAPRDFDVTNRILQATGEEPVGDGRVYEDRSNARSAARSYREACRWRGATYHYRVDSVPGGFAWRAWTTRTKGASLGRGR